MSDTKTFERQAAALKDPLDIVSASPHDCGITAPTLEFKMSDGFTELLHQFNITLFITREYENLVIALNPEKNGIRQSFFPLPHPSGIAVDRHTNKLYVAATRNPNQLIEFKITKGEIQREENTNKFHSDLFLIPSRVKYYPGAYYFHDLAFIGKSLYANSVGMNAVMKIDFSNSEPEQLTWWPKCVEEKTRRPNTRANYIQLNSIAAGSSLENSYFSASGSTVSSVQPGHLNYPVDKKGVIFSGKTRDVSARGLTRPHSARLYKNKLWIANSGYGEFGYIEKEKFIPIIKLPGWTRGLFIHKDVAFVGVSRIIPRFKQYAPGIKNNKIICGVYAVSLKTNKIVGVVTWRYGNQIFGIDSMDAKTTGGFAYTKATPSSQSQKDFFYKYR